MDELVAQLRRDEDWKSDPYRDSLGFLTIGCGHNLDAEGLCDAAIEAQLLHDISTHKTAMLGKFPWMRDLSPPRLGAFINLAFNLGVGGLATFKNALKMAESGDWDACASHLLDSKYAQQVGERAQRVATQLRTDTWT